METLAQNENNWIGPGINCGTRFVSVYTKFLFCVFITVQPALLFLTGSCQYGNVAKIS